MKGNLQTTIKSKIKDLIEKKEKLRIKIEVYEDVLYEIEEMQSEDIKSEKKNRLYLNLIN